MPSPDDLNAAMSVPAESSGRNLVIRISEPTNDNQGNWTLPYFQYSDMTWVTRQQIEELSRSTSMASLFSNIFSNARTNFDNWLSRMPPIHRWVREFNTQMDIEHERDAFCLKVWALGHFKLGDEQQMAALMEFVDEKWQGNITPIVIPTATPRLDMLRSQLGAVEVTEWSEPPDTLSYSVGGGQGGATGSYSVAHPPLDVTRMMTPERMRRATSGLMRAPSPFGGCPTSSIADILRWLSVEDDTTQNIRYALTAAYHLAGTSDGSPHNLAIELTRSLQERLERRRALDMNEAQARVAQGWAVGQDNANWIGENRRATPEQRQRADYRRYRAFPQTENLRERPVTFREEPYAGESPAVNEEAAEPAEPRNRAERRADAARQPRPSRMGRLRRTIWPFHGD